MRIISFAWTTPALLAGAKTVTRRDCKPEHAASFHAGDLVSAYDQNPRARGKKVATIRITRDPWRQNSRALTLDDYKREGFEWLDAQAIPTRLNQMARMSWREAFELWRRAATDEWVVEFELVEAVV